MSTTHLHEKTSITRALLLVALALGPAAACTTTREQQDPRKNQEVFEHIDDIGDGRLNAADY